MKGGTQTFAAFKGNSYFKALDGLRAVSILMVLFHHAPKYPPQHFLHALQENGRYGVSFFFAISGFLICTLLLREEERNGKIDLWKFYGRRALRLLPLYYAALLLQAILVFGLKQYTPENQALFAEKLPAYLLYYSNWLATATQGPFFQSWSLAVEEQFYLLFGLMLLLASRRVIIGAILAGLFVKFAVYQMFGAVDAGSALWRVIFSYQEPILYGVLAAFALNSRKCYEFLAQCLRPLWLVTGLGVGMAAWLCLHQMRLQSTWDAQLLYGLMTVVVICLVVRPSTPFLENRWMTHIGKISYGIYLLHMFVISLVKKIPGGNSPVLCFLFSLVLTCVAASLVYKYFEQPIIAFYKRKFSPCNAKPANSTPSTKAETPESPIIPFPAIGS
jgi:peptidoglycan/LPS O-acetylase OafA/YrhL